MQASDAIRAVRRDLKIAHQQGLLHLEIRAFDAYLASVEQHADAAESANALDVQLRVAGAQLEHASRLDMAREVNESAKGALSTIILVNGGAAVAMLGYLGGAHAQFPNSGVRDAMSWFGAGVLLGTIGFATRYFSGSAYLLGQQWRSDAFTWTTIVAGLAAIGTFGVGLIQAYWAF